VNNAGDINVDLSDISFEQNSKVILDPPPSQVSMLVRCFRILSSVAKQLQAARFVTRGLSLNYRTAYF
jgi:hypothetical protein